MSSTIRTLMRSLIEAGFPYWVGLTATGPCLLLEWGRDRHLDDLGRQDLVDVHEGLQDDAGRLRRLPGVGRWAQDRVERAGRSGEQEDLRLLRRHGEDQQLVGAGDHGLRAGGRSSLAFGRSR